MGIDERGEQGAEPRQEVGDDDPGEAAPPEGEEQGAPETAPKPDPEEGEPKEPEGEPRARQPHRTVFRELNEIRTQKRAAEADTKKILDLVGATSVEDAVAKIESLRSSAPLSPEFAEAAREMGVEDPENLKRLSDLISKQVRGEMAGEIEPLKQRIGEYEAGAADMAAEREWSASVAAMDEEWAGLAPAIEAEYKPDTQTLAKARELMVELAHSEEYHDKELEYVLWREQERFEEILGNRRRRSMLPARGAPQAPEAREDTTASGLPRIVPGDHASILKAREATRRIAASQGLDDRDHDQV